MPGEGKPTSKVNRDGELDWQNPEDHPMVLGGDTNTGSGSIDARDQEDHPWVKDNTDGELHWRDQEDHPWVKDDENQGGSSISDLYNDMMGKDSATGLSASVALVAASVLVAYI